MKKVLFVAHVDSHIRHFHIPYLKYFKEKGYEVHVATSNDENEIFPYCDVKHTVNFERNPVKFNNIKAIKQMKKILQEEKFDLIHCHTPMGGVVTRLACKEARKNGTKVLYTAHGFHFYKGAPLINWCVFYPIEKRLSRYTDGIITINEEDFFLAKKYFHAKNVYRIHGVGVDDSRFHKINLTYKEKETIKRELNIRENDFVIMYVAELNKNKNQILLINAMKRVINDMPYTKLFLIGNGELFNFYNKRIKELQLENNIKLLGYRNNVEKILQFADLYVATSIREGLGLNLVEALLCNVPCLAKKNRGHNEIIIEDVNGYLFETKQELINRIIEIQNNKEILEELRNNCISSVKQFTLENAYREQINIYESIC